MSRKYKFYNEKGVYLISFATVNWIDVFTRSQYKDIVVESINYCIKEKGLEVFAWVIMTNHVHLAARTQKEPLEDILRDLKKYTSKAIIKAIEENPQESRKGWLLWMFERAGNKNSNNSRYQFWQQHNQPEELVHRAAFENAIQYIHENPVKEGFVFRAEDYPYSSAVDYSGGKGLVAVGLAE
jgi:REP element-mobilizing transposase RayT